MVPPNPGILPTKDERSQQEQADREKRQQADHELLRDLQRRQTDSQAIQAKSSRATMFFTFGMIIVALGNAGVSFFQFQAAKSSADTARATYDAMKSSAVDNAKQTQVITDQLIRTANATTESVKRADAARVSSEKYSQAALDAGIAASRNDQRPWVDIQAIAVSDTWYWEPANNSYVISFAFTLRNIGKTPALGVWISPMIVADAFASNIIRAQKEACESGQLPGFTLFPNRPVTNAITLTLAQREIDEINHKTGSGRPENGIIALAGLSPGLVGCVGYYSSFSPIPFITGFSYEIRLNERAGGVGGPAHIPVSKQPIPKERFLIYENPLSNGNWAR